VSALLSWAVRDSLNFHVNLGRDFLRSQPNIAPSGVSLQWSPVSPAWLVAAERYVEDETHFARAGLRWFASDRWTLEASRAQSLRGPRPSNWTLAATWAFAR